MNTGLAGCLEALIHNVIHSSCGYPEKLNEIRGLVVTMILHERLQGYEYCFYEEIISAKWHRCALSEAAKGAVEARVSEDETSFLQPFRGNALAFE